MRFILRSVSMVVLLFGTAALVFALIENAGRFAFAKASFLEFGIGAFLYAVVRLALWILRRNLEFAETFCHELNHAVFAVLSGRKLESFFAHAEKGGQMTFSGKANPVIALAPYSFPLFAFVVSLLSFVLIPTAQSVAYVLVGFFLAFHLASVWHEAWPRQTDLKLYGLPFSYAAILFSNVFWVSEIMLFCTRERTAEIFGQSLNEIWLRSAFDFVKHWGLFLWNLV